MHVEYIFFSEIVGLAINGEKYQNISCGKMCHQEGRRIKKNISIVCEESFRQRS